jgi:hypothetical protein
MSKGYGSKQRAVLAYLTEHRERPTLRRAAFVRRETGEQVAALYHKQSGWVPVVEFVGGRVTAENRSEYETFRRAVTTLVRARQIETATMELILPGDMKHRPRAVLHARLMSPAKRLAMRRRDRAELSQA